jgi:acyl carrier protein
MESNSTLDRLTLIVARHTSVLPASLSQSATIADVGIDSLEKVELAYEIEDEFGVALEDSGIKPNTSLRDLAEMIDHLLAAKPV